MLNAINTLQALQQITSTNIQAQIWLLELQQACTLQFMKFVWAVTSTLTLCHAIIC